MESGHFSLSGTRGNLRRASLSLNSGTSSEASPSVPILSGRGTARICLWAHPGIFIFLGTLAVETYDSTHRSEHSYEGHGDRAWEYCLPNMKLCFYVRLHLPQKVSILCSLGNSAVANRKAMRNVFWSLHGYRTYLCYSEQFHSVSELE